jgi:hypothetical protein
MTSINQSNGQGALFELVARGQKDTFFVKDAPGSAYPFDPRYESSVHHLAERKTTVPITRTNFGGTFDVEIDTFADILTECAFEIDLPSWIPSLPIVSGGQPVPSTTVNGLFPITTNDPSATSYGYVNYIGYLLFESIQLYQDQFLIQEWSGDGLLAKQLCEGSWNSSNLQQVCGGYYNDTDNPTRSIQFRATPNHIRIKLPIPGCGPKDKGLPICAMAWQRLRIRATLRKLEDLVVCSDTTVFKPAPWNIPSFSYTFDDGTLNTFSPKSIYEIGEPVILLSTIQHYVLPEIQKELRSITIEIPFRKQFANTFTFGELDFIQLDKGGISSVTRPLDIRHPTEKIYWFFRNQTAVDTNRLDSFRNEYFDTHATTPTQPHTMPYGEFYYGIKLLIAGKDREELNSPIVWNSICQFTKNELGTNSHISQMCWNLGDSYGTVYPSYRQPEGTINFTTADRPTLYIQLSNVNASPYLGQRRAEMKLFTESWNVYVIEDGRGRCMFAS